MHQHDSHKIQEKAEAQEETVQESETPEELNDEPAAAPEQPVDEEN